MSSQRPRKSRNRSRELFARLEPLLTVLEAVLSLLPTRLQTIGFEALRHVPTRVGIAVRYVLLRHLAGSCGRLVAVFEGVYIRGLQALNVGSNVSIHPMCYIDATAGLSIGNDVSIAHGVTIMTTEHDFSDPTQPIRDVPAKGAPVFIGDDVWIGAGVKILAGVTIGSHSVVGAGAVVTRDVPSGCLALGVPARVAKQIR